VQAVADRIELSPSGRSRCRACQQTIEKGALRLGAAVPNPFGEGDATHYYHLECGAWRQPDAYLAAVGAAGEGAESAVLDGLEASRREALSQTAELSQRHHRLRRFVKVERAKTARAHCRHCRETIDKGELRLCLEIIEDGRVGAAGFLHLPCARPYAGPVETALPHLARSDEVTDDDFGAVRTALESGAESRSE
jgi:hypothetical protein